MRKLFVAFVAALTIAGAVVAAPRHADAGNGGAVAAGIVGGLAAGAIIAGAAAPYYAPPPPPPAYYPAPAYYAPPPCGWVNQRYWDGYYWRVRRVPAC